MERSINLMMKPKILACCWHQNLDWQRLLTSPDPMNLLNWNCQGLRNPQTVNALKKVVKKEEPKIVFLMEMKSNKDWMVMVCDKYEFKHGVFVSSNEMNGGLALMWKEDIKVELQTFSPSHVDALVDGGIEYGWWRVMDFYGNLEMAKRPEAWVKLKQLSTTSTLPWIVIGDFNEITGMSKKEGGSARPRQQMTNFVNTINYCGLRDIGFVGPKYTWWYVRRDGEQI